ncbi:hypothetical protein BT93_I1483 [Corymbia citriodora subsp. variegata]|nr:hypothetical protein BT93_I1483 [Corymbia citriodora subsp. variegata]
MENARRKIPDFFKVYMPEYSSQRMLVPRAFLAQLDGPLSGEILLRCRMGWQWRVKVILEAQDAYFEDGWQEFVRDNLVEKCDFMVFSHQSPGVFRVVLFGRSGCEKKECTLPAEVGKGSEVREHDRDDGEEAEEDEDWSKRSKKTGNIEERKAADEDRINVMRYINAKNPHFMTTIRTFRSSYLFVPHTVRVDYELKLPHAIEFQDPTGRSWRGTVKVWKDGRTWITGWGALCRHNNLKKNDWCICEFPEENGFTGRIIKVHTVGGNST